MKAENMSQRNEQYKYASTREKFCFGIGAIGKDAICNMVGAFLMLYFTDTLYLVHTATFRGQQGRISRTVWAILNGQPSRSAERTFVHSANQYSL